MREGEKEREGGKFYYVLGEESLNVYSLGTDTAEVFLLQLGRASIPSHSPPPSKPGSQNNTLPTLIRFPPLGIFLQLEIKEARKLKDGFQAGLIPRVVSTSSNSFCFVMS